MTISSDFLFLLLFIQAELQNQTTAESARQLSRR